MSDYDLHRTDSYAMHLAEVNQTQPVLATEDIHNEKGVLLVRKGHAIQAETAQRLLNHRLLRPLDTSISVSDALDGRALFNGIVTLLQQDPESQAIHQALNLDPSLKHACFQLKSFPLISQKMTVMSLRLPDEFQRGLFCAWFCMALAAQLRNPEIDGQQAFYAGLAHNSGLLHIDPEIVAKSGAYTPDEWRAVQSHPLIGEMFLSQVPGLDPAVPRAAREHHERCDGSGYPAALWEDRLSLLGQIVAVADTAWAICKPAGNGKYASLEDVLTIVKMNRAQFPAALESALYHLQYRGQQLSEQRRIINHDTAGDVARLYNLQRDLDARYHIITPLITHLEPQVGDATLRSAYVRSQRIWFVVNGSGLLSQQLTTGGPNEDDPNRRYERYDLALMLAELQWQFFQLERSLQQVVRHNTHCPAPVSEKIRVVLEELSQLPRQAAPDTAANCSVEQELHWTMR